MSRPIRLLIVAVVAVAAVGGYWKLALAPKRAEAKRLQDSMAVVESQVAQSQSLIATYQGAQKDYKTNYETMTRLGKAVPADDDTRSLVVQVDTSAKRSGIDFDTISLNATSSGPAPGAAATTTPTAPGAINAGAFSALPFSFTFTGEFDMLGHFFSRIENFVTLDGDKINVRGRLMRIESISLRPAEDGWPGLQADIGASAYIVPKTPDAAAAKTTTPSTTTAAGATPSAANAG